MSKLKEATPNISKPNIKLGPWNCEIARNMFLRFSELTNLYVVEHHDDNAFTPWYYVSRERGFYTHFTLSEIDEIYDWNISNIAKVNKSDIFVYLNNVYNRREVTVLCNGHV